MASPKLRIVYSADDIVTANADSSTSTPVKVRLEEVFPALAEAVTSQRSWLQDFADEEVAISSDLYEVILAYQHHRAAA